MDDAACQTDPGETAMGNNISQKLALPALAAAVFACGSLIANATVEPAPAYGAAAGRLEGAAIFSNAEKVFERADLNNDGYLGDEEYSILAVVTAELARLNGFIVVDAQEGVLTVRTLLSDKADLSHRDKEAIRDRAVREHARIAGDDQRVTRDEFVDAALERFIASDTDRNGRLTGEELTVFAASQAKVGIATS